ncbi:MAG TPA: hypothetical protein VFB28_04590 [Terriglobales bacterium]|nr:hypothetical protein [Terriglobales bacterium]
MTEVEEASSSHKSTIFACLIITAAVLCVAAPVWAQTPAAYVYVSSSPSANNYEINAFSAASNGQLTAIGGSPFEGNVQYLAGTSKYLFGENGIDITSFAIAADGSLQQVGSIDAQSYNQGHCGGPFTLFLDRTGTLYDLDFYGNSCANNPYQFFSVDSSSGELTYMGVTREASPEYVGSLSFLGNNTYAYGASCYKWMAAIYGFQRNSEGSLTDLNINPALPTAAQGDFFCPSLASSDGKNHVAISVQSLNGSTFQPTGPPQLAVYTAGSKGRLTTRSAYTNMPSTAVTTVLDLQASPAGDLLAVAGTGGLQVFHFNGQNAITRYTQLLTNSEIDQIAWDHANHLYALSQSTGKLFVFTVTSSSVKRVQGSPYSIANPVNIAVVTP